MSGKVFGDFMIERTAKLEKELAIATRKLIDIRRAIESGEGYISKLEEKIADILDRVQP